MAQAKRKEAVVLPDTPDPTAGAVVPGPEFHGTIEQFLKYIGPVMRNQVKTDSSKAKKAAGGICRGCGHKDKLQAAHIEKSRPDMARATLTAMGVDSSQRFKVDLEQFEHQFRACHKVAPAALELLCEACHSTYDTFCERELAHVKRLKLPDEPFTGWFDAAKKPPTIEGIYECVATGAPATRNIRGHGFSFWDGKKWGPLYINTHQAGSRRKGLRKAIATVGRYRGLRPELWPAPRPPYDPT